LGDFASIGIFSALLLGIELYFELFATLAQLNTRLFPTYDILIK